MPAELGTQRAEHSARSPGVVVAGKAGEQRVGDHWGGGALFDGGLERPAAFAAIGDARAVAGQFGVFGQRIGAQIEQP